MLCGQRKSEVSVELNGQRHRKTFATSGRMVEQRRVGHREQQKSWQVKTRTSRASFGRAAAELGEIALVH